MVKLVSIAMILFGSVNGEPMPAHKYSAGFHWSFISWGISGRYFPNPNFYIQGNAIFGYRKNYEEWLAYSVGGGIGRFFFVDEWLRPFIGLEAGTGTSKELWATTTNTGGRFLLGVAISVFDFLSTPTQKSALSGLTLELETGLRYSYHLRSWHSYPQWDHYMSRNDFYGFPDFGVSVYYNW